MNREEELKKEVEKLEAKLEAFKKELDKPKTHYPLIKDGVTNFAVGRDGSLMELVSARPARQKVGNCFLSKEKAERSNLYKILNSEYDYWFPGFSEKPDFEPNGLESLSIHHVWSESTLPTWGWETQVYRWKRSEN